MDPARSKSILQLAKTVLSDDQLPSLSKRCIAAAEEFLTERKFQLCREAAFGAQMFYPENPAVPQLLAIAETLFAASETLPNLYAILGVPRYSNDSLAMSDQYKKLCLLLDPNKTHLPFAGEAFNFVKKAWNELSNESRKSQYDKKLRIIEEESGGADPTSGSKSQPTRNSNIQEPSKANCPITVPGFSCEISRAKRSRPFKKSMNVRSVCVFCAASFVCGGNHLVCWNCGKLWRSVAIEIDSVEDGKIISKESLNAATGVLKKELKTEEVDLKITEEKNRRLIMVRFKNEIVDKFDLDAEGEAIEDDDGGEFVASKKKMKLGKISSSTDLDAKESTAKKNPNTNNDDKQLKSEPGRIWAKCPYCNKEYEYTVKSGYDKDECLLRCKNEECKEEYLALDGKFPPLKKMKIMRTGTGLSMVEPAKDGVAKQLKPEDLQPGKIYLRGLMKVSPDTGKYDQEEVEKKNKEKELKTEKINVSVQRGGFDLDPAEACYIMWLTCPYCEHQNEYNLRYDIDDKHDLMSCKNKGCRGEFYPSDTKEFKGAY